MNKIIGNVRGMRDLLNNDSIKKSNIAAKHKNHIHIHYRDGSIRIGAN